jgi:hypothetical protein
LFAKSFIAKANIGITMQHRRAYRSMHTGGVANCHLFKRWTNEELLLSGKVVIEPRWRRCAARKVMRAKALRSVT